MRTLLFLLQKEFKQIFRDKTILAMILVMPVIQLSVLPFAADYEIDNFNITIVDHNHSAFSRQLTHKIESSRYFTLVGYGNSYPKARNQIDEDQADLVLDIPANFERGLVRRKPQNLFIAANAIKGIKANLGTAYLQQIIRGFNANIILKLTHSTEKNDVLEIATLNWYNPLMSYQLFMVPGFLAILLTMVGGFLTALNIVKEKEVGTIEQINVTPIKKHHFILGKLIPFWVLGNIVFTIGLFVAWLVYGIVVMGNFWVLYLFVSVFLLAILGFGLLISTFCQTQQQAMLTMFFCMMIFILMGGLFTSIESMPLWGQWVAKLNPLAYLIQVIRMVVLKGSGLQDILYQIVVMGVFAVVLNAAAVLNYRKTV